MNPFERSPLASEDGYSAPVEKSLYAPRLVAELPREVCAFWWGLVMIAALALDMWIVWRVVVLAGGLVGHMLLAYLGRKNPKWVAQLKRYLHHMWSIRSPMDDPMPDEEQPLEMEIPWDASRRHVIIDLPEAEPRRKGHMDA